MTTNKHMNLSYKTPGFTIVELMVVISILGILATMTSFGWSNWQQGISEKEVKSDVISLANAMESAKNFGAGYPTTLPATYKASSNVTPEWKWGDGTQYCVQITSKKLSTVVFNIRNGQGSSPQAGQCPASPLVPPVPGVPAIAGTFVEGATTSFSWNAVAGAASYQVQWRQNGGAWTNVTRPSTSGSYSRSGAIPATNDYQVRSVNSSGATSAWSAMQSLATFNGPTYATLCQDGGQSYVSWGGVPSTTYPKYRIDLEGDSDNLSEEIINPLTTNTTYYHPVSYDEGVASFGQVYFMNNLGHLSGAREFASTSGQGGSCLE